MTDSPATRQISFVLVEPRYGGNVGATARALKNNGFDGLRLVRPPELGDEAERMAMGSLDLLRQARHFDSLDDAIADANLVVGFTARGRRDQREVLSLESAVPRLIAGAKEGRVALLFGREDRGLTARELDPCHYFVRIPAAEERQVYNLSQAVLLAAYALRRESRKDGATAEIERPPPESSSLTAGERRHLRERIEAILVQLGYREHADPGLLDRIVRRTDRLIDRSGVDASDQAMILGVLRRIERLSEDRPR